MKFAFSAAIFGLCWRSTSGRLQIKRYFNLKLLTVAVINFAEDN